jgi:hypothetical protein
MEGHMGLKLNIAVVTVAALMVSVLSTEANAKGAGWVGYCKGLVAAKNLKTGEMRSTEFNKCKSDPGGYK